MLTVVDRRDAIYEAVRDAAAGDLVPIAGKGHEKYQEIGGRTLPLTMWRSHERRWRPDVNGARGCDELRLPLEWAADAVAGDIRRGDPRGEVGNVVIDTRVLQPGDFFVALRGDRFDGHDFVNDAFGRGAGGVIVRRGFGGNVINGHGAVIEVDDTTKALQRLGHAVRRASGARVVAITGSAGKTTTKDTIAEFSLRGSGW